jgi:hypothetical protein
MKKEEERWSRGSRKRRRSSRGCSELQLLPFRHKIYLNIFFVFPVHAMKVYRESKGMAPLILNLSTRWR